MGSTIVTLGPSPDNKGATTVSAFEEAFGEYSEARGKGRARRKKRRLERIANRKEVRAARREEKKERKVGRQQVKQAVKQARVAKRAAAQADRQAKRTAAMAARQERRFQRKEMRLQRKALGDSPEAEMDDQAMVENGVQGSIPRPISPQDDNYSEPEQVDTGSVEDTTSVDTQQDASAPAPRPQGSGVPQYTETELDGMNQSGYEDEGYGYEGNADEGYGDEGYGDEGYGDEGYGDEGYSEDGSGFDGDEFSYANDDTDGIIALEDDYSEFGVTSVNPGVQQTANKVEWNKELISRLEDKKESNPSKTSEVDAKIQNCMKRIAELELQLSKYQNFDGDFSSADGEFYEFSEARGKRKTKPEQKRGRVKEVIKAKRVAREERKNVQSDNTLKKKLKRAFPPAIAIRKFKQIKAKRMMENGGDVTPVESELNPEFSEQRIEIPAEETSSSASGTGLNGLDLKRDFDAPRARYVELSSNADGDEKPKTNWVSIVLAVGIVAAVVWAIRKNDK